MSAGLLIVCLPLDVSRFRSVLARGWQKGGQDGLGTHGLLYLTGVWDNQCKQDTSNREGVGLVSDINKRNLVYFENPSMRGLYDCMEGWQQANNRRLLSVSVQQDGGKYCCIALINPTEVVITSLNGKNHAYVNNEGFLRITEYGGA